MCFVCLLHPNKIISSSKGPLDQAGVLVSTAQCLDDLLAFLPSPLLFEPWTEVVWLCTVDCRYQNRASVFTTNACLYCRLRPSVSPAPHSAHLHGFQSRQGHVSSFVIVKRRWSLYTCMYPPVWCKSCCWLLGRSRARLFMLFFHIPPDSGEAESSLENTLLAAVSSATC